MNGLFALLPSFPSQVQRDAAAAGANQRLMGRVLRDWLLLLSEAGKSSAWSAAEGSRRFVASRVVPVGPAWQGVAWHGIHGW